MATEKPKYKGPMTYTCPICGKPRSVGSHKNCSKIMQARIKAGNPTTGASKP